MINTTRQNNLFPPISLTLTLALATTTLTLGTLNAQADSFSVESASTSPNGGSTVDGDDSLTVTESGTITTTTQSAIRTTGTNNNIVINGTVTTTSGNAFGVDLFSDSTVINNGSVFTNGADSIGILASDNNIITNTGLISTRGEEADGIAANDGNTITNTGTISVFGANANGIYANDGNKVTNAGTLITTGSSTDAIFLDDNNTITNTGTISVFGANANGIYANDSNKITNAGTLTTTGSSSDAIYVDDGNTVSNTGTITTTGNNAEGINADDENVIFNSGMISMSGDFADGIFTDHDNTITNTGWISVTGTGANAIDISDDNVVTNTGSVISAQAKAFRFDGANNTLNLNAPSFVGGQFDLGAITTLNITTGSSHSILWTFNPTQLVGAAPTITGSVPTFQKTVSATELLVTTFDPTGLSAASDSLANTTGLISGVTQSRLSQTPNSNALSYAAQTSTIIDETFLEVETSNNGWAQVVGSLAAYGDTGTSNPSKQLQLALVAGYDWSLSSDTIFGVMAGASLGKLTATSKFATALERDTKGLFAGIYGRKSFDNIFLNLGLSGGFSHHNDDRLVNDNLAPLGVAHAVSDYSSLWINPEVTLGMTYQLSEEWTAAPSARLSYASQWAEGYSETDSRANATIAARQIGVTELSFEWAATRKIDTGTLTGRLGYTYRATSGDSTTDVTIFGTTQSLANNAQNRHIAYVGADASFALNQSLNLDLATQIEFGENYIGGTGKIKLTAKF